MRGRHTLPLFAAIFLMGNLICEHILEHSRHLRTSAAIAGSIAACLILILFVTSVFAKQKPKRTIYFAIAFLCGTAGLSTKQFFVPDRMSLILKDGTTLPIEAVITDFGQTKKGNRYLKASILGEKTFIYGISADVKCNIGDTLHTTVMVNAVKNFTTKFDYERHMAKKGIFHTCFIKQDASVIIHAKSRLQIKLLPALLRESFSNAIDSMFPLKNEHETKAFIKAITSGYRDELSENTKEAFRKTGAMHLLALSGMHLGIIYSILSSFLSLFTHSRSTRKIRSVLLLAILWSYTVFTGCGMSILRAMTMVTFYETATLLERQRNGPCALALSIIIITVLDPYAPSDIGFQLSCCAMSGIFIIAPFLNKLFPVKNTLLCKFRDTCTICISCQIFTAPLILITFGNFAVYSLFASILCSPLTSLALMLTPLAFINSGALAFIGENSITALKLIVKCILAINSALSEI